LPSCTRADVSSAADAGVLRRRQAAPAPRSTAPCSLSARKARRSIPRHFASRLALLESLGSCTNVQSACCRSSVYPCWYFVSSGLQALHVRWSIRKSLDLGAREQGRGCVVVIQLSVRDNAAGKETCRSGGVLSRHVPLLRRSAR
jgi:hypothetical protein